MKRNGNRTQTLFRYSIILLLLLPVLIGIVNKMVHNTIIDANEWNIKADSILNQTEPVLPVRGDILAADGSVLATNIQVYDLRIDYRCEGFKADTLKRYLPALSDSLAKYYPRRSSQEWSAYLTKPLTKKPLTRSHPLLLGVSYADMKRVKSFPFFHKGKRYSGLVSESKLKRVRPYGNMARRSVGRVGESTDWKGVHGITGLECALDSLLYGTPGVAHKIPLTHGIVNWTDTPAVNGCHVMTTIDIKMQDIVENELNNMLELTHADWGVAVLMDVATGDIKAISNLERDRNSGRYIEGMNRAVLGYEPGSVIKTLSMMIAIEDGLVRPDEYINTSGPFAYAGGRAISDSHHNGTIRAREVIERSSNIGMTKIIARGYDSHPGGFYHRVKQTGFFEPFHTGLAGECRPKFDSVPDDRGGRITMSRQCYGYATLIPPLHTLSVYNAIANDGKYVRPRLVNRLITDEVDSILPVTYVRERVCSPATAATMREMLTSVVFGDHGTGRRLRDPRVPIAGKTGTCYMTDTTGHYLNSKRLAFCGFFPADKPVYSCIVLTCNPREHAFGAASTSGEVLKNIALKLYSRGMLNNSSDYMAADKPANHTGIPTFYATTNAGRNDKVSQHLGIERRKAMSPPTKQSESGHLPDVRGLGLYEALTSIENHGISVSFSGSGYVTQQTPAPGTPIHPGLKVSLVLHE